MSEFSKKARLAFVVSHPIQYYAPIYQHLARRKDVDIKVFFTWHAGQSVVHDRGFGKSFAWDIPLTNGYEFELVPNISSEPGTHRFFGLRNPKLVEHVLAWAPDAVHLTGWAWSSNLKLMHALCGRNVKLLFRGDSHLLDDHQTGPRWWAKHELLKRIYRWPTVFLVTGRANRNYYRAFGVDDDRLIPCPHSIDVARFAARGFEEEAQRWRAELGISPYHVVVLFAGKFERKKRPLELMRALQEIAPVNCVGVMVGDGPLKTEVDGIAAERPDMFRVLPFQNQSRMPIVYRLGDLFVLPSAYGETWGLAVNEAMASERAVLVSDKVGCAEDVVDAHSGRIYRSNQPDALETALKELITDKRKLAEMGRAAGVQSWRFDTTVVAQTIAETVAGMKSR
jgi:glycosyltransferase involved in cell wall biosynthesis